MYIFLKQGPKFKLKFIIGCIHFLSSFFSDVSQLNFPYIATAGASADDDIVNKPTVHEQEDGTFFAVCATGTSSKDSLLSWIRCLEKHGNPKLGKVSVLFTFKSPIGATVSIENENEEQKSVDQEKPPIES